MIPREPSLGGRDGGATGFFHDLLCDLEQTTSPFWASNKDQDKMIVKYMLSCSVRSNKFSSTCNFMFIYYKRNISSYIQCLLEFGRLEKCGYIKL